jgi:superfamily II DNA/RNA helicase
MPQQRQTLMFSATLPSNIVTLSGRYLKDPMRISVGSTVQPILKIKQEIIRTSEAAKYDELLLQLQKRTGSILVFVKTKHGAEKLSIRLRHEKHSVDTLHGDLRQNKRDRVIKAFRDQRHRILVATDVAARGLDIPHIEHVVNYDLPQCPEDYIHRIGRTGRAGAEGNAVNLITSQDGIKWRAIHRLINPGEKNPQDALDFPSSGKRNSGGFRGRPGAAPRSNASKDKKPFAKKFFGGAQNTTNKKTTYQGKRRTD